MPALVECGFRWWSGDSSPGDDPDNSVTQLRDAAPGEYRPHLIIE